MQTRIEIFRYRWIIIVTANGQDYKVAEAVINQPWEDNWKEAQMEIMEMDIHDIIVR